MSGGGIVIAIDGPSGCGKGTVARQVAERLGYLHVDSGAMYRVVALLAAEKGIPLDESGRVAVLASQARIRLQKSESGMRVEAAGRDVTEAIRRPEISEAASQVALHEAVRRTLVVQQQALGSQGGMVMDGRDIGTVVFPAAELKVYLDASAEERARRRYLQDGAESGGKTLEETLEEIRERDRRDTGRAVSPLRRAADAVYLDTTAMEAGEVADVIVGLARERGGADRAPD